MALTPPPPSSAMSEQQLRSMIDAAQPTDRFSVLLRRTKVQDELRIHVVTHLTRERSTVRFQGPAGDAFARPLGAIKRIERLAPE